jgi:alcohol dehydrogenase YqhD (iron-dependent ADH family)
MLDFVFQAPTRIIFGSGKLTEAVKEIQSFGNKVLLVYGGGSIKQNGLYQDLTTRLQENGISWYELSGVQPNPRIDHVRVGVALCREHHIPLILAVGGGSVIDCCKLIAAGYYYDGDPWDFLLHQARITQALPLGVILTIAATGSEMNGNTVISNEETQDKLATWSELFYPRFSVLDPTYTMSLPARQTAAGVVDIMSHVFEQYFSGNTDAFLQDRLGEAVLLTCIHYAPLALQSPQDYTARANIMWAGTIALNGLLGTGKTTDWATHGLEHEVSALYDVTHGVGLAILHPYWMRYVLDETEPGIAKFSQFARNAWGLSGADSMELSLQGIARTREFFNSLGMPTTLREVGVREEDLAVMAKKVVRFGPKGGYKILDEADALKIYRMAY